MQPFRKTCVFLENNIIERGETEQGLLLREVSRGLGLGCYRRKFTRTILGLFYQISFREWIGPRHMGSFSRTSGEISGSVPCHGVSSHFCDP